MQDVCLTPVDHELAIIGLIAPNISRHAFFLGTLSAGLALAVDFGLLYYFSFPAIHYFIHLAIASILYYCHFRFHDGISLFQIRCTFKERTQFKKRISASSFLQPLMYDKFLAFCATALIMLTFALFIMVILKAGTLSILGSKIQICITLVLIIATPCYSFISSFHYSHAEENLAAAAEYSRMLLQVAAAGEVGRK